MTELVFEREHVKEAILRSNKQANNNDNGLGWLYDTYRKPGGKMQKSRTGFVMYDACLSG